MAQNLKAIYEGSFVKGYNDKDKPENLRGSKGEVYMADIKNGFIEQNKIVKRKGYATIGDAPESKAILGQARHEPSGGSKYILRARNNSGDTQSEVEGWSGSGNWTSLTGAISQTADLKHNFVMAENATYIFNGTDTVLKTTNGTSTSTVAAIPKGSDAKWWHNFLFVIGVSGNKSRLYFSDVNEPETFDGANGFIDVNADDGEEITAIAALQDTLFIFKPTKIFTLTGYGVSDFTLADLGDFAAGGVGTIAPQSVVETGKDIFYMSYFGDTPHFRSIQRTREGFFVDYGIISDNITGTMDRLTTSQLSNTSGIFDGRRLWQAVTTSGTTNNEVLVYDTLTKGWTRLDGINASVFHLSTISGSPVIYFGSSSANGKSYQLLSGTNDDGSAIDFLIDTPMYAPSPGAKSRFKYLYMTADVSSDVDIDVDYSPDGFTFTDLSTLELTGEGAAFGTAVFGTSKFGATAVARNRLDFAGGQAYYMQYRFRNNTTDEDVSIREWEIFYKSRGLRSL